MGEITVPLHAPELSGGVWLQGPEVSVAFSRGAVILVDFWESTCLYCLRTLPYVEAWHRRYRSRGLVVIGVHTPELEISAEAEVVAAAAREHGLTYPILLDPEREIWERFANHYWPAKYLVDHRGYLRWEHFGEGAYGAAEEWIQRLLAEAGDEGPMPPLLEPVRPEDRPGAACHRPSPELYLGWHRGKLLAAEGYRPQQEVLHSGPPPEPLAPGVFTARGHWFHGAEYLESRAAAAELELIADAAGVYAVVGTAEGGAGALRVELFDGERWVPLPEELWGRDVGVGSDGAAEARWQAPRLVHLLEAPAFARHHLRLTAPRPGIRLYTLTFSGCVREES